MSAVESLRYICPELSLLVSALFILILGLFVKRPKLLGIAALLAAAAALFCLPQAYNAAAPLFSNLLINDPFSKLLKEIILIAVFIAVLISLEYKKFPDEDRGEYYFLLLFSAIAMMLAVSANNLLMIYVAFEMISLISYILAGFLKHERLSNEAGLKYFLFGSFATSIMLYGISFIYGLFGSTDLSVIAQVLAGGGGGSFAVSISLILVFVGVAFKCAFVPLHLWAPDTYEGAPAPVAAFISTAPKVVGFAILIKIFWNVFSPLFPDWIGFFTFVSIVTMSLGNIAAFSQGNIKRMLGYSSISQAGYILIGFTSATALGKTSVLFYLLVYCLTNLGAFGCIVLIAKAIKSNLIKDYSGMSKKDPFASAMLAIFLLSLAGLPPLGGFFAKFLVFSAAIDSKFILLAVAAALNSVVALYYYLRVIKYMYLEEPRIYLGINRRKGRTPPQDAKMSPLPAKDYRIGSRATDIELGSVPLRIALIAISAGVLLTGILPGLFLSWIAAAF